MIGMDEFLNTLDIKFSEHYTIGICGSIIKSYANRNMSYSIEDIKQDCIIYYLEKDRYTKIRNTNGARIAIEFYLKMVYRNVVGQGKKQEYYDRNSFIPRDELEVLLGFGYNDVELKLHGYFYRNIECKRLNLHSVLMKNGKVNHIKVVQSLITLLSKVEDINEDKNIIGICKYLDTRKRSNLPDMFIYTYEKKNIKIVVYKYMISYLKKKYINIMEEIIGN